MTKSKVPSWRFDPDDVKTSGNVGLVVVKRAGKSLKGYRVSLHSNVATQLRNACVATLKMFGERTARAFDPDVQILPDQYLTVADSAVDVDASVRELMVGAGGLPFLAADELPKQGFLFYAVLVGPATERNVFIRKYNPRQVARGGRFWTVFGEDLRVLEEPIFVFDPRFDMVMTAEGIAVLHQRAFELIFRDLSVMQQRLPVYVDHIASNLPLAGDGAVRFLARCVQNSRVANRARSIYERGHLANVTIKEVRAEIKKQKLDESKLIKNGELIFDDNDPYPLLKLLNEDLFLGGLSSIAYEVGSKSTR